MKMLRAVRPPPYSQDAEDKPTSLFGPGEETRSYQRADSLTDTQMSGLKSSVPWLRVPALMQSETQQPTSRGDVVNCIYVTHSTRSPS